MPITVHPSKSPLSSVKRYGEPAEGAKDAKELLQPASGDLSKKCGEIFQSSFASGTFSPSAERFAFTDLSKSKVCFKRNGLVDTAVLAYNNHHHLVLRPDDVWIAILSQFNLYVNANAKQLRHLFVTHKGKKHLVITLPGSRYDVHFGRFAKYMGHLIQENVKDPELREWIIPKFSTTTDNDRIVSSIMMMATLKAYFSYECFLACGLPAVTMLGEKADWETLLAKAEKLPSYGEQTAQWHALLKPVLGGFVRSFEEPDSERTKDFWQKIAHFSNGGSGPTYLSGWITAFCFFDTEGKPLYSSDTVGKETNWDGEELGTLNMDGVDYHRVETGDIAASYAEVDVKLNDNGVEFKTVMVAGLVGMEITSSGVKGKDHEGKDDTVQPVAGWWLFEERAIPKPESHRTFMDLLRNSRKAPSF
ncbi:unnamed protein product [Calypogeia fissa]